MDATDLQPERRQPGPPKQYTERKLVTLLPGMLIALEDVCGPDETVMDVIREAIGREVERRARAKQRRSMARS